MIYTILVTTASEDDYIWDEWLYEKEAILMFGGDLLVYMLLVGIWDDPVTVTLGVRQRKDRYFDPSTTCLIHTLLTDML